MKYYLTLETSLRTEGYRIYPEVLKKRHQNTEIKEYQSFYSINDYEQNTAGPYCVQRIFAHILCKQ